MAGTAVTGRLRASPRPGLAVAIACLLAGGPAVAAAQQATRPASVQRIEATPIGALPPLSLPMPASRDHNFWGVRAQAGSRSRGSEANTLHAVAGGLDLQWRGGSTFGATAGYQTRACAPAGSDCGGHALFDVRARLGVLTGGPAIAALFGSNSGTTTVGIETGFGFAPEYVPGANACTVDLGVPLSIAMLQRVRLVTYATPAVVWDFDCWSRGEPSSSSYLLNGGIGLQQVAGRSLDLYLGVQRIFRGAPGYLVGVSVTYLRLP